MLTAMRHRLTRFARDRRGAVLLEFALVVTVLLVLVFGIIDFGRLLFTANNFSAAVREGARFASVQQSLPATAAIQSAVVARTSVLGGNAVTANNVAVTYGMSNGQYASITVQLTDTFPYLTPIAPLLGLGNNRVITTRSQFRWESAP